MEFMEQLTIWAKGEATQGKIMIGAGIVLLFALIAIFRSENTLLKGAVIPVCLMLVVLIGYGSFVLTSRPTHVKEAAVLYQVTPEKAIAEEITKQEKDYNSCITLMRIYPILMILAALALLFVPSMHYKGMALGFILLFATAFLIDAGFASRSLPFLTHLKA